MKRNIKNVVAIIIVLVAGFLMSAYVPKAQAEQRAKTVLSIQVQETFVDFEAEKENKLLQEIQEYEERRQKEEVEKILKLREEEKEEQKRIMEEMAKAKEQMEKDINLIAEVMYAEEEEYVNKPNSERIFKLAGSVIIHRTNCHFEGATTIEETIYAKGQYASRTKNLIGKQEIPDKVYEWARDLVENGPIGPENLLYQGDKKCGGEVYEQIGNQYFCLGKIK